MKQTAAVLLLLLAAACASSSPDSGPTAAAVNLSEPEVLIQQISSVPMAMRNESGGQPIQYRVQVTNRAAEPITLKRITVASMGEGGYQINPTSRPFDKRIDANGRETVEFWVPANLIYGSSMAGAHTPVVMRVVTEFDSARGTFQNTIVEQVTPPQ